MSNTKVDMPKVCQMLDNGWEIMLFRNQLGSYSAEAMHRQAGRSEDVVERLWEQYGEASGLEKETFVEVHLDEGYIITDDFTPEQALTRLAYKAVDGVIL